MVNLDEMSPLVLVIVVTAITLGLGATVLSSIQGTNTENGTAWNASRDGMAGINTMASWLPTIAIIIAAAVVIGILAVMFVGRQ